MAKHKINWQGIFVVSVTPFDETGAFDEKSCRMLIDQFINEGIDGIIVAGSTGEWFALSNEERIHLFEVAANQVDGRVKVLGGTCAINTRDAVELTTAAKGIGLDGVLLLPPPYVHPTEIEVLKFFEKVSDIGLPIMMYNNPPRTQVNINATLGKKLCNFDSIVALKDSVKDIHQLSETIISLGDRLAIFCGIETYALPCLQRGADGIVAMAPNIIGAKAVEFFRYVLSGNWTEAVVVESIIDRLYREFYAPGHSPYVIIKECMNLLGRPGGMPREPLLPLSESAKMNLKVVMQELKLI